MMLVVWFADLYTRYRSRELTLIKASKIILLSTVLILFSMYAIGYFTISNSFSSGGYGYYKLNLNAFINPYYEPYSSIIKPLPAGKGDYEGINYLGFGVLVMITIILFSARKHSMRIFQWIKPHSPLITLGLLTTIYAISNNITLGENTLVEFYIPTFLDGITNSFRASGRFAWILYYLILTASVVGIYKSFCNRTATIIIIVCTYLNVYDVHHIFKERRNTYLQQNTGYVMDSTKWNYVKENYKKILAVSPWEFSEDSVKWAYYASTNNMSMNFGYFARYNSEAWDKQTKKIEDEVNSGKLDNNAVYLFKDKSHYEEILRKLGSTAFTFEDNGVYVIALK